MANLRTSQVRNRSKPQLSESWVVESDGDDEIEVAKKSTNHSAQSINSPPRNQRRIPSGNPEPKQRLRGRPPRDATVEPELIMPSIHEGDMVPSWSDNRGTPKASKRPRIGKATKEPEVSRNRPAMHERLAELAEDSRTSMKPVISWIYDVLGGALNALKIPISYAIAIYLLFGLMLLLRNLLTTSIYTALSPICRVPGVSLFNLPMCQSNMPGNYKGDQAPPVEFDQLMTVQSKFEEVLEASAGGVSLPLDMKRGETSIRDLRQVVRFSQLRSKNELVLEFDGFIETARIASYDLQKFNSHIGRGVDNILATARWTQRVLDSISDSRSSRGAIQSFFTDKLLAPFQPLRFTEETLLNQYIQHTQIVEEEINRLIDEAQVLLQTLQNLEDRLDVIHGITLRDNHHTQGSKDEVLMHLWTMLGGNRNKLGKFDSQLKLLRQVNEYRQTAFAHVSGTIVKLQAMGTELEELRERVASAELLREHGHIPLSVHMENIQLGVERLEAGRIHAKKVEHEHMRKTLDRGRLDEKLIGSN